MLHENSTCTKEGDADYVLEYAITEKRATEKEKEAEYGIRCCLYKAKIMMDSEEVKDITSERSRIEKFLEILERNRVFPVHLKDVKRI